MNSFAVRRRYIHRCISVAVLLLCTAVTNGCLIVPTPSQGVGVITAETVKSLEPGKSTRADVLHLLGDPAYVVEQNRFFVYWWKETVAYFISEYYWSGATDTHYLLVEFTADNRLKRLELMKSKPNRDVLNETVDRWKKDEASGVPQTRSE